MVSGAVSKAYIEGINKPDYLLIISLAHLNPTVEHLSNPGDNSMSICI